MAEASRDQNFVPTILGVSSVDGITPVKIYADPTTHRILTDIPGGMGTVTSVSVVSANGLAGTVANATTTPAITLSTTVSGLLKGNGTAISAASDGSDYLSSSTGVLLSNVTTTATANKIVQRDSNANIFGNNLIEGYSSTATAAGTTTLTVASAEVQYFTGITTQTVILPDATTLTVGHSFRIFNTSTGLVTIQKNGGSTLWILGANTDIYILCTDNSTNAGSWTTHYLASGIASGKKLSFANSLLFSGTDGSSVAFGTGGTVLYSGGALGTPSSGTLTNCTFPTLNQNTTGSAATLTTPRAIYGNNFDGSAALTQIIASTYGGTGNGFTKFTGPTTAEKTFTLPDSSATLLYSGGALGTPSSGTLTNCTFPTLNQNTTGTAAGLSATLVPSKGGTGVANNDSSTITISGNYGTTFTVSGTTSVTLPTSGTLAISSAAQTFTGTQTFSQIVTTNNAITASGNAATVPITSRISTVTNNSAATLTITMTTTNAVDGQLVMVRVLDATAVAQTISWVNTENSTIVVPTTSNGSTTLPLTVGFQYNSNSSKWRCIASA